MPFVDFGRRLKSALALTFAPPGPFERADVEAQFKARTASNLAGYRRAGIALAACVWIASSYLDFLTIDLRAWTLSDTVVVCLRVGGAGAIILGGALASRRRFLEHDYATSVIYCSSIICYLPLLGMLIVLDYPYSSVSDLAGLILCVFFIVMIFRPAARLMLGLVSVMLPAGVAGLCFADRLSVAMAAQPQYAGQGLAAGAGVDDFLTSTIVYLCATMLIAYVIAAQLERQGRTSFEREIRLEAAQAELARASQDKSKFIADAAHDLSQPTHALSLLAEATTLALSAGDMKRVPDLVRQTLEAARYARASFQDILEISRFDSGLIDPDIRPVDLAALLDEIVEAMRPMADEKNVRLHYRRRDRAALIVVSDRALLSRALINIISNAVKYADPGKPANRRVVISALARPDYARVDIADNGVGVAADELENIFKRFVRLNHAAHDREHGLGLGLSIVQTIMRMLDKHSLRVRSEESVGTRFSFYLPRSRTADATVVEAESEASRFDFSGLFFWCVEDDELVRSATLSLFEQIGALVDMAASYEEARSELVHAERRPDLLITDFRFPSGRTAEDVVSLFTARWGHEIPVLILTGDAEAPKSYSDVTQYEFLRKPATGDALLRAIGRLCATSPARVGEQESRALFEQPL